eukprot:TRINITY_DN52541_c0_g1_i1.p1 TRINITY_DN52541_c0_g1~~TRINITY_DN52541_c0_g1_i1.p1  ORF type:complete len:700 (+),score=148.60 TRINITY_DN52541_c0_g1_i1:30-2129(+)
MSEDDYSDDFSSDEETDEKSTAVMSEDTGVLSVAAVEQPNETPKRAASNRSEMREGRETPSTASRSTTSEQKRPASERKEAASDDEATAALCLQRNYRGYKDRKKTKKKREERDKQKQQEDAAAGTIQRKFRVHQANKEVTARREKKKKTDEAIAESVKQQAPAITDPYVSNPATAHEVVVKALQDANVPLPDSPPSSFFDPPSNFASTVTSDWKNGTQSSAAKPPSSSTGSTPADDVFETESLAAMRKKWEAEWNADKDKQEGEAAKPDAKNETPKLTPAQEAKEQIAELQRLLWEKEWMWEQQREDENKRNAEWLKEKRKIEETSLQSILNARVQDERDRRAFAEAQHKKDLSALSKAAKDQLEDAHNQIESQEEQYEKIHNRRQQLEAMAAAKAEAEMKTWEQQHKAMELLVAEQKRREESEQRQKEEERRMLEDRAQAAREKEEARMKELVARQERLAAEKEKLRLEKQAREDMERNQIENMKREMEAEQKKMADLEKYRLELQERREAEREKLAEEEKAWKEQQLLAEIQLANQLVADKKRQAIEEHEKAEHERELREKRMAERQEARLREAREKDRLKEKKDEWVQHQPNQSVYEQERADLAKKKEEDQRQRAQQRQQRKIDMVHNAKQQREDRDRMQKAQQTEREAAVAERREQRSIDMEEARDRRELMRNLKDRFLSHASHIAELAASMNE